MSELTSGEFRYTTERYLGLVDEGLLAPDDRVELLEGVIVAEPPQEPRHASATTRVARALERAIRTRAVIRVQMPFLAGHYSVPEPDIALVPGREADYDTRHPSAALLVVEVADSSLPQDRLTKSRIYAAAAVPEYWIVNLRDDYVEVLSTPDAETRLYTERRVAGRGDTLALASFPGATIMVNDVLPGRD